MKMKKTYFVFAILVSLFLSDIIYAIPAFARKYDMSCQTCHSPIPRLKPYGDDFAGNGFVLADQDAPRYYVETGDPLLDLIREFPFAVRFDVMTTYNNGNTESSDFAVPWGAKLLSGGEIAEDIAYYFYFYISEHGEVAGLEDAYIMFNDVFGIDFDIYAGQFQVSDPLFKRELRLTYEDYSVYTTQPGLAKANLTYDRGLMLTLGLDSGTDIIAEIVNGNGIGEASGMLYDSDEYKNFAGRVSQDIGDFLRVGVFAYNGKEDMFNNTGGSVTNNVTMYGPDITVGYKDIVQLNAQYMVRTDDKLFLVNNDQTPTLDLETKGALAELIVTPDGDDSEWYAVGMFNWVESEYNALNYKTATGHIGYLLRRNIRVFGEVTYDLRNEYPRMALGIVSAF